MVLTRRQSGGRRTRKGYTIAVVGVLAGLALWGAAMLRSHGIAGQTMPDGSVLTLNQVRFGERIRFVHGTAIQRIFRRMIPAKGISFGSVKLDPPKVQAFGQAGPPNLVLELKVDSLGGQAPAMAKPGSLRQIVGIALGEAVYHRSYRGIITGEDGLDYAQELRDFTPFTDGLFSYLPVSTFTRDSRRLRFRIDRREARDAPWQTVAEFEFKNPARPLNRAWKAEGFPQPRKPPDSASRWGK